MVIDGNSILNRAFYGVRLLTNHEGLFTNAVYGFLSTLLRLREEYQPDRIAVCFDVRQKTFRHEQYEAYKGTRKGMPDELAVQLPIMHEVLEAMGIPCLEKPGFEADDLLGTLSRQTEENGDTCLLVTGDKDSLQLVGDNTHVLLVVTRKGQTTTTDYTTEVFREQYGFDPIHMIDLKGLMGDTSDNIPGVPGIGEKTAMGLVQKFGTVSAVYDNIDDPFIKNGQRKKLLEGREMAEKSRMLATIVRDVPMEMTASEIPAPVQDNAALYQLFTRLEFKNYITRFGLEAPEEETEKSRPVTWKPAKTLDELSTFVKDAERVVLTAPRSLEAVCLLCGGEARVARADAFGAEGWKELLTWLFSGKVPLVLHDGKELLCALLREGIQPEGIVFDTALGAYLLNPAESGYTLDKVALAYLRREIPDSRDYEDENAFSLLGGREEAPKTLCVHAQVIAELADAILPKIDEEGMHDLYYEVELPLMTVLAEMQVIGFEADAGALHSFGESLSGRIAELTAEIYQQAGEEFNINSTKKLGEILFEKLELPVIKKTKRGYSTNIEVLEALRGYHVIADLLIEYRQLTKLQSTYVDGLLKVIDPKDGRIRSTFQQMATATGRLSSTDPNLQNIPVRQELGSELRHMFRAKDGCVLVDADYSQIELRVLAHIAQDETMIEAFQGDTDIHTVTASQVFRCAPEDVTPLMRRSAKAVNFGIVYGISSFSLAKDINVTVKQAGEYIKNYLETYYGVRDYMERIKEEARENGYVSTLFGRRRYLPELKSKNFNIRSFGERVALNTPIQGTAADIIKIAMVRVSQRLKREQLRGRLILQVHDELILEVPEEESERAQQILVEEMEQACRLSVPLRVDAACGKDWYAAKG
ncbi:MAG: DNA polymerase I [Eubacteriales bacterium]|nr:DNA polymerase I [Eubacteriales bacterium]